MDHLEELREECRTTYRALREKVSMMPLPAPLPEKKYL
jgi:hypothetical protein